MLDPRGQLLRAAVGFAGCSLLQRGDRLTDETGDYEVIGRPYTTADGKTANARVKIVESDVTMIRAWGAHERVAVKRTGGA
jgi:hypothetical protein